MGWFASAFALGLMMALFHRLTAGGALEARATLALGFLLLAAQLGGDIARRARLPRITGYLLTGFAVGPAWLGLVRADEVGALRLIADAAVALIAFAAGSELTLDTLRRERVGLTRSRRSVSSVDRKSTRLNSSHLVISYAVFCLKKKKTTLTEPL